MSELVEHAVVAGQRSRIVEAETTALEIVEGADRGVVGDDELGEVSGALIGARVVVDGSHAGEDHRWAGLSGHPRVGGGADEADVSPPVGEGVWGARSGAGAGRLARHRHVEIEGGGEEVGDALVQAEGDPRRQEGEQAKHRRLL